ncbi:putative RNA-directed DNA polymerase [Tanacetum coccineum]
MEDRWISQVLERETAPVLTVGRDAKKINISHSNKKGKATQGKYNRRSKRKAEYEIAPTSDPKDAGLKESRRLKHGELNLDGYKFSFDNENGDILVYSIDCFMFKASHCKDIFETIECISDNGNVIFHDGVLESFDFKSDDVCESCLLGKMTKSPFTGTCERGEGLLDLVHTDVCGPFRSATKDGKRYYVTFTDDFSRYGYVYLIKHKSDTFEVFKRYQNEVENQLGRKIKVLRSDRGGEYLSIEFFDHLKNYGIVSQLTPPRTPQLNGVAERRNRTLLDMVRSMMCRATLPISFWGYALETAAHILNLVPTKKVSKTPFEMWKGKYPSLRHIKI